MDGSASPLADELARLQQSLTLVIQITFDKSRKYGFFRLVYHTLCQGIPVSSYPDTSVFSRIWD